MSEMASHKNTTTASSEDLKKENEPPSDNEDGNRNHDGKFRHLKLVVGVLLPLLVITVVVSSVYIVKAMNSSGDEIQNDTITRAQHFIEVPEPTNSIIAGGELVLRCIIGNLAGKVQWIRNGVVLGNKADQIKKQCKQCTLIGDPSQGEYNLLVQNVRQPGTFECQVSPDPKTNQNELTASTHVTVQVDDVDYYEEYSGDEVMAGRPLIVEGNSRTTHSEAHNIIDKRDQLWTLGEPPTVHPRNPHNQDIGRQWMRLAEAEHASVASFTRHTLQLMSMGAPSWLLVASQNASLDEIKHAKICYGFASAFLNMDLGPGLLNVQGSLKSLDVKQIIGSLIVEGCIGETLSAMEVHLAAQYATDASVKSALELIASDETKHSQLAWDTLFWILETFTDTQSLVEEVFKAELENHLTPLKNESHFDTSVLCRESEKDSAFHKYGLLVKADRDKVQEFGIRYIIKPVYQGGFKDAKMISKLITDLDITVLASCEKSTGTRFCKG